MKTNKKRLGNTLIEVVMALCVLGVIVPASLGAFGTVFVTELRIHEHAYMMSSAEWWFSRLSFPVYMPDIDAAPRADRHGKVRFGWDTEKLDNGAIRVTLRVYGRLAVQPLTVSRIF